MSIKLLTKVNNASHIFNGMDTFRMFIQKRQAELGISQNELAEKAGKTGAWLSRFMSGDRKDIKVDTLIRLADALGVSPVKLIIAYEGRDPEDIPADVTSEQLDLEILTAMDRVKELIKKKEGGA